MVMSYGAPIFRASTIINALNKRGDFIVVLWFVCSSLSK